MNPAKDGFIISTLTNPTNKSAPYDELFPNQRQSSEFLPSNQVSTKILNKVEEEVPINDLYMNSFVEKKGNLLIKKWKNRTPTRRDDKLFNNLNQIN